MNNLYKEFLDSHILVNTYNYGELESSQVIKSTLEDFKEKIEKIGGIVLEKNNIGFSYYYPEDLSHEQFHVYQLIEDLVNDKSVWFKYAEFYTKKVLEKVSEEVVVDFYIPDDASIPDYVKDEIEVYALKHSITDIELPKHE